MKKIYCKMLCILLSCMMILSCLMTSGLLAFAAIDIPDGYTDYASAAESEMELFDFNNVGSFVSLGLPPSTANTRDGNLYSIHWDNHVQNFDLYIYPNAEKTDWTGYNAVDTWIYSEKATNATVMFLAMSPQSAGGAQYFWQKFTINWTGWKHIVFNLDELNVNREPSYDSITTVRFCSGYGWNLVAHPETDLYIASLRILKVSPDVEDKICKAISAYVSQQEIIESLVSSRNERKMSSGDYIEVYVAFECRPKINFKPYINWIESLI